MDLKFGTFGLLINWKSGKKNYGDEVGSTEVNMSENSLFNVVDFPGTGGLSLPWNGYCGHRTHLIRFDLTYGK